MRSLSIIPAYEAPSSWWQHVPIAHFLVEQLKPGIIVELGTHYGVSFFSFCEAARELSEDTYVYAIDTWEGDEQAGNYGSDVYDYVNDYHYKHHYQRSQLVRSYFDDAVKQFADKSIGLLHIDGLHTYEAVKHDFETWLPKLKDGGTILFHDWNVKTEGFGVWKLWDELKRDGRFKCTETPNGYGLGIATLSQEEPKWFESFKNHIEDIRCKGFLLDNINNLKQEIKITNNELITNKKHIKHLETMIEKMKDELKKADMNTRYQQIKVSELEDKLNKFKIGRTLLNGLRKMRDRIRACFREY